jgi:hypothetical protein
MYGDGIMRRCQSCRNIFGRKREATVIFYSKEVHLSFLFFRCQECYDAITHPEEYQVLTPEEYEIYKIMLV